MAVLGHHTVGMPVNLIFANKSEQTPNSSLYQDVRVFYKCVFENSKTLNMIQWNLVNDAKVLVKFDR